MRSDGAIAGDLVKGAIAGAAATWLMGQATSWMYEHEDPEARQREDQARGDRTAYETAAEKAAGIAQVELSKEQRGQAGLAIHWATGMVSPFGLGPERFCSQPPHDRTRGGAPGARRHAPTPR